MIILLSLPGCAGTQPGKPLDVPALAALPRASASHVIVMVMENEESTAVLHSRAAPYINSLVRRYGLASDSYAVAHPSLPNYLALTSGSTQGVSSDCTSCTVDATNIVDQLEGARVSWKAYLEDVPGACFRGAGAAGYAKKHNPFIYYDDIARSPRRCSHLVGFTQLSADLRDGRLPTYVWISPNLCDDGHDCGVAGSDRFLSRTLPSLLRELGPHGFLILTWDEGSSDRGCCGAGRGGGRIATILLGPDVRAGGEDARPLNHYGVLGTIEEALGLPRLAGAADPQSGRLSALFKRRPQLSRISPAR